MENAKEIISSANSPGVVEKKAIGGAYEGARAFDRETATWFPNQLSPDQNITLVKPILDARSRDLEENTGYIHGAVNIARDSIVGAEYRLTARPNWKALGLSNEGWANEFQETVEPKFDVLANSLNFYIDAHGMDTLTGLVRLAVGIGVLAGEYVGTFEWLKGAGRPVNTAFNMISLERLSNPNGRMDTKVLRRGVQKNSFGAPLSYWFRNSYPTEAYPDQGNAQFTWTNVPRTKPWGRLQVLHVADRMYADQSRGIADIVSVLKQSRMTNVFQDVSLQNAVVQASYAASIESELPPDVAFSQIGVQPGEFAWLDHINRYLANVGKYIERAQGIAIDGVKIPHLYPGQKLQLRPMGTPGGVGQDFEKSLLRHTCAALGISYEEFSRDFSQVSYSAARASMLTTFRSMQYRKKRDADALASAIYTNVVEEWIADGDLPLPPGKKRSWFYEPLAREAICACTWVGGGRGQIDELKETQAAMLRVQSGLSTYEEECAKMGKDYREVFEQLAREQGIIAEKKLVLNLSTTRPGGALPNPQTAEIDKGDTQDTQPDDQDVSNEA